MSNNLDYSSDYDFSGTVFSTDPGVHNDRPAGRYVTRAEQLAEKAAAALAKARSECEHIEALYGAGVLDDHAELLDELSICRAEMEGQS